MSDSSGRVRGPYLTHPEQTAYGQLFSSLHRQPAHPAPSGSFNSGQQRTSGVSTHAPSAPPDVLAAIGPHYAQPGLSRPAEGHPTGRDAWCNGDERGQLAVAQLPPASLPSFDEGLSLPQGITLPPIPTGPSSLLSALEDDSRGGFDGDFVNPLEDKHKCSICLLALREPVQTNCGHRFCRSCIEPIRKQRNPQCPIDKEPLQKIFPDNFCKREVLALLVNCNNSAGGCKWTGQLREMKVHLDSCTFALAMCPHWERGCQLRMFQSKLKQHVELECEYRDSLCEFCRSTLPLKEVELHVKDACPEVDIQCVNECGAMVKRKEVPEHIQNVCPNTISNCQFGGIGCNFKGDRSSMKDHMTECQGYHLTLTVEKNSSLEQQVAKLNEIVLEKDQTVARLDEQCSQFENLFEDLTTRMTALECNSERQARLKVRLNAVEGLVNAELVTAQPAGAMNSSIVSAMTKKVDEAMEMAARAEAGVSTAQQKVTTVESKVTSLDCQVGQINTLVGRTDAILAEFDLRLLSQETTSFTGVLVWKIPVFSRHFEEARMGKKPSLYSPPFYTSRHGYKMCVRVYLHGDGVGKSSHMSVFFVVMRGEFDALLAWPFHQKVTLTLLDQSLGKRHISDTFLPDPSSSSFQRPSTEMNIASGCPRFVSIDTLRTANGYVRDNTIFLRVAINCTGLPAY